MSSRESSVVVATALEAVFKNVRLGVCDGEDELLSMGRLAVFMNGWLGFLDTCRWQPFYYMTTFQTFLAMNVENTNQREFSQAATRGLSPLFCHRLSHPLQRPESMIGAFCSNDALRQYK